MQNKLLRHKKRLIATHRRRVRILKQISRHPLAMAVFTLGILLWITAVGLAAYHFRANDKTARADTRVVLITYDGDTKVVPARPQTVKSLLKKLNITINPGDVVEPEVSTKIVQDNFRINIYRARPVEIVDGDREIFSYSAATTARSVAAQTGATLYAEDRVSARPVSNFVKEGGIGERITIERSTAVNLNLYGTPAPTRTLATTVGELLKEKNIVLRNGATVTPAAETPISPNMQLFVLKEGVRIESSEETIPMPVQNIDDNNLTLGSRAIRQAGAAGKQLTTYEITVDPATGKEISRTIIQRVIIQNPITQIVAIGKNINIPRDKISLMRAVGIAESDYGYVDYIISHEGGWNGVTKYNYAGSGAYGICQALPGSKMASAGADWATNPVTQLKWCDSYAKSRYKGWAGAYNFWLRNHYW